MNVFVNKIEPYKSFSKFQSTNFWIFEIGDVKLIKFQKEKNANSQFQKVHGTNESILTVILIISDLQFIISLRT